MADALDKTIVTNRAAFHEYFIENRYEAGIALAGTEVKSIRAGAVQLKDSYVQIESGEAWLKNLHVSPYSHGNRENHDATRPRKLLLHRREIDKLEQAATIKGMTLVVTKIYLKKGRIKFEIGVARGKKLYDKRESEMRRTMERDVRAQLKERGKRE